MNDEEYLQTQHTLTIVAGILQDMDLSGFIERINTAETVGPFKDPTLYRKAMDRVQVMKETAQLALAFKNAYEWLKPGTLTNAATPDKPPGPIVPPKNKRFVPEGSEEALARTTTDLTSDEAEKLFPCGVKTDLGGNLRCGRCGDIVRAKDELEKITLCETCDHICAIVVGFDP